MSNANPTTATLKTRDWAIQTPLLLHRKLEIEQWKLEIEQWKLDIEQWNLEIAQSLDFIAQSLVFIAQSLDWAIQTPLLLHRKLEIEQYKPHYCYIEN